MFNFGARYLLKPIHKIRQAIFLHIEIPRTTKKIKTYNLWWALGLPLVWVYVRRSIIRIARCFVNIYGYTISTKEVRKTLLMDPYAILFLIISLYTGLDIFTTTKTHWPNVHNLFHHPIIAYNIPLSSVFTVSNLEITLLLIIIVKLIFAKTPLKSFLLLNLTILFILVKSYSIGLEPVIYFFVISEISGAFILLTASLKKQTNWQSTHTPLLIFLIPITLLLLSQITYSNWLYFNFYNQIYSSSWNDFQSILISVFFNKVNIVIIMSIIYVFTLLLISIFNGRKVVKSQTNFHSTLATNLNIFKNNILRKWGV